MRKTNVAVVMLAAVLMTLTAGCSGVDEIVSPSSSSGGGGTIDTPASDQVDLGGSGSPPQNLR